MKIKALVLASATAVVTTVASTAVMAQEATFDVSEATGTLGAVSGGLVAIGGVLIGLAATAVGFKWIKGMIFG